MSGFDARNFWIFVAGAATVVVLEVIRRWSQHDDQHDDGDDDGDDGQGGGVHERVDTQLYDFPTGPQPRPLADAAREEYLERIRMGLDIPEGVWDLEGPWHWAGCDPWSER